MSDYSCYAGPVARCKVEYVATTMKACVNEKCSAYKRGGGPGGNFCNMCAQPYGETESAYKREKVNAYDRGLTGNALTSQLATSDRIYMNVRRDGPREMHFDPSDEVTESIGAGQTESEKDWFCAAFSEEIAKLRAAYGNQNVTIEWLVMSWYS